MPDPERRYPLSPELERRYGPLIHEVSFEALGKAIGSFTGRRDPSGRDYVHVLPEESQWGIYDPDVPLDPVVRYVTIYREDALSLHRALDAARAHAWVERAWPSFDDHDRDDRIRSLLYLVNGSTVEVMGELVDRTEVPEDASRLRLEMDEYIRDFCEIPPSTRFIARPNGYRSSGSIAGETWGGQTPITERVVGGGRPPPEIGTTAWQEREYQRAMRHQCADRWWQEGPLSEATCSDPDCWWCGPDGARSWRSRAQISGWSWWEGLYAVPDPNRDYSVWETFVDGQTRRFAGMQPWHYQLLLLRELAISESTRPDLLGRARITGITGPAPTPDDLAADAIEGPRELPECHDPRPAPRNASRAESFDDFLKRSATIIEECSR